MAKMIRWLFALYFKLTGWKFVNKIPDELRSFVFIGAPHTNNYDIVPAMAVSYLMKRNARFVIKKEWLNFPLNLFFSPMGAIGLDRQQLKEAKTVSTTDVMARFFADHNDFVLMISPEGTRSPVKNWKTGFYYIAQKAKVPIVLGYCDYKNKQAGMGMVIYPEDFETDMKKIMDFYRSIEGHTPEKFLLDERYSR